MKMVSIGDINLNVLDRGSGGIPILFVHGFPLDHTMWRRQSDYFSDHERVIVPDLRGFGKSGVTKGTVTMEQHADDLAKLLDALHVDEPIIYCGLSMGGYIGWQFWKQHRERLRGLVQCDTRALPDTKEAAANRLQQAERVVVEGSGFVADAMLPRLFAAETIAEQPEMVAAMERIMRATPSEGIAAAARGMAMRENFIEQIEQIDVPTLIVVGEHDAIAPPEEMQTIADAIPEAVWLQVPGAGHMAPLENPTVFNDGLAEFITM
ncbi:MAG TPA: alpha/beta fold hydrolase [Pirellulales bacterium]|nr:alpha/beta fold hydrolase [Pirellulales bacterium]